MTREYFMTTARIGFCCWTISDLPLALALWTDPEVTRLIGGPLVEALVNQRLTTEIESMAQDNVQYWPIFLLSNGEHVGCAGLRPHRPSEKIYELGFHLRPAYWGRRLAEEGAKAVIDYAFNVLGANGLFAGHHPANAPSRRVLQKLGFRFTHEEFYPPTGLKHPSYLLVRSEWSASSGGAGRSSRP
jgi:[ribosomal protein S5]-alanine N-acetyltransferase